MRAFLCVLALLLPAAYARAQTHCVAEDTIDSCLEKVQAFVNGRDTTQPEVAKKSAEIVENTIEDAADVSENAEALVARKNTGDASATTINDFLPLLRAIVDTAGVTGQEGERYGVEWSNPLGLPVEHQNKLTVVLARSEMYEPLKDALRAASLDNQIAPLEEDINEGDDISIGFSYSPASRKYGRDPELHSDLFSSLLHAADIPDLIEQQARGRMKSLEDELGIPEDFEGQFSAIAEPGRRRYISAVEEWALAQFEAMEALGQRLEKTGFYGLTDLVNNQPQLSLTADYRSRDDAVGPDEFRAVLAYEHGWSNVNAFRKYARSEQCAGREVLCLADYLARNDVIANLRESRRIAFRAEYSQLKGVDFALADPAFTYSEESTERFSLSGAMGMYLGREGQGRTRPRVDVSLSYEDFSDDPVRQDRGLATATVTFPVAEAFFLSVAAVYATKPEFRGDVDAELGARAGVIYKVITE